MPGCCHSISWPTCLLPPWRSRGLGCSHFCAGRHVSESFFGHTPGPLVDATLRADRPASTPHLVGWACQLGLFVPGSRQQFPSLHAFSSCLPCPSFFQKGRKCHPFPFFNRPWQQHWRTLVTPIIIIGNELQVASVWRFRGQASTSSIASYRGFFVVLVRLGSVCSSPSLPFLGCFVG